MSQVQPKRIKPGGTIMGLALTDADHVYLLVRLEQGAGCLLRLNLDGHIHFRLNLPGPNNYPFASPRRKMRITEEGSAWLGEGKALSHIAANGRVQVTIDLPLETGEELGSFLVLSDGFVAAIYRPSGKVRGRVARLDSAGSIVWSSTLPADAVAYVGVVEMRADTGWQMRPKQPWQPEDWQPAWRGEPLVLSGDRLLARYFELASGLGRTFCLDWTSGRILWATESRPEDSVALLGPAQFLLGVQGYDAFDLYLYDRDGTERLHWPSHAEVVVTEAGEVRGVEMENVSPSRMHFSVFERNGAVRKGPHLNGYYTTYPVVNRQGVAAFWRNGKLRIVDASLEKQTLWRGADLADDGIMTRMLLAEDGTLVFGVDDELLLMPTDLGPMAVSSWPCGGGNARDNPVFQEETAGPNGSV